MSDKNTHTDDGNLENEAPFLFGLKKEEPYKAPVGYFEKFQSELSDKIHTEKSSGWNFILKPAFWAPAMVVLVIGVIFLFKPDSPGYENKINEAHTALSLNEVSLEELDSYVSDHLLAQANTEEIMDMIGTENLSMGIEAKTEVQDTPQIKHVEEDEMEEYILENLDEMEIY